MPKRETISKGLIAFDEKTVDAIYPRNFLNITNDNTPPTKFRLVGYHLQLILP